MNEFHNVLASFSQFICNPSIQELAKVETEPVITFYSRDFFRYTFLISSAAKLLNLPQISTAVAQVIFSRFCCRISQEKLPMLHVSMGCLILSSKLTENIRRVRDIVNIVYYLHHTNPIPSSVVSISIYEKAKMPILDYIGPEYYAWRDNATFAEAVILRELGFQLEVNLPYALLINYAKLLEIIQIKHLVSKALGYLNDSFHTSIHILFQPTVVACSCILLACRDCLHPLPNHWNDIFDANLESLECVSRIIYNLYSIKTT